jgi:hypothetical protein
MIIRLFILLLPVVFDKSVHKWKIGNCKTGYSREIMRKQYFFTAALIGVFLFASYGAYAGTEVPDVIKMENEAYDVHKKAVMTFSHKIHIDEYKAGCGKCHHDDKGNPLDNLNVGDDVQDCVECHNIPGERPKGKGAPKLTKKERLDYHAEAIHYNCVGCHKKVNKEKGLKPKSEGASPVLCKHCHPKGKKQTVIVQKRVTKDSEQVQVR